MGVGKGLVASIGVTVAALGAAMPVGAARIVDEWRPGVAETGLGGDLTVDGYGVSGLGFYRVTLDDGASALAVCVQADVGHSASAEYVAEAPATITPELDYLLWRYASPERPEATNDQAAAINVLSWWYAGAQRRSGGPVWRDPSGSTIELDVVGVGRLDGIEAAVHALREEATRQRGPWALSDLASVDGVARVRVIGPGGPISGAAVTFTSGDASLDAVTDADGLASAPMTVIDVTGRAGAESGPDDRTRRAGVAAARHGRPTDHDRGVVGRAHVRPRRPRPRSTTTTTSHDDDHDDHDPTSTTTPTTVTTTSADHDDACHDADDRARDASAHRRRQPDADAARRRCVRWRRAARAARCAALQPGRWCAASRRCTSASEVAEKSRTTGRRR